EHFSSGGRPLPRRESDSPLGRGLSRVGRALPFSGKPIPNSFGLSPTRFCLIPDFPSGALDSLITWRRGPDRTGSRRQKSREVAAQDLSELPLNRGACQIEHHGEP